MTRISKKLFLIPLLGFLIFFGAMAAYLRNPNLDAAVLNALPLGLIGGIAALLYGATVSLAKRKWHRSLWLVLVFPLLGSLPVLSWIIGDKIFEKSEQWELYVFSDLDNGLSYKKLGSFTSSELCSVQGEALMMNPPRLPIQGCNGDVCLASHFFCGLDCATDTDEENIFVSEIMCREKTLVH